MSRVLSRGFLEVFGTNNIISSEQSANIQLYRAGNGTSYFTLQNDPSLLLFEKSDYNLKSHLFFFQLPWVREPQLYSKRVQEPHVCKVGWILFPPDPKESLLCFISQWFFSLGSVRLHDKTVSCLSVCMCFFQEKLLKSFQEECPPFHFLLVLPLCLHFSFQPRGERSWAVLARVPDCEVRD